MQKLPVSLKLKAVRQVLEGATLKEVSGKYKCSRQSLSSWIKKYKQKSGAPQSLQASYRKGKSHPRSINWKTEKEILDFVIKSPGIGPGAIAEAISAKLKIKISSHGVYTILCKYDLTKADKRRKFSVYHPVKTVFAAAIPPQQRVKAVEQHLTEGKNISNICKAWSISRPTFYNWLSRYKQAVQQEKQDQAAQFLERAYKRGYENKRAVNEQIREIVISAVAQDPKLSVHKIYTQLKQNPGNIVGHHAIQNILQRENLNTYEKRRIFVQGYAPEPQILPAPLYRPEVPLYRLRQILAPFVTVPKLLFTKPKKGIPSAILLFSPFVAIVLWFKLLSFAPPSTSSLGLIFASVSLLFGIFFFIYSMKYYITILLVLKLAQAGESGKPGLFAKLGKLLGVKHQDRVNPLLVNLEKVQLSSHPFVSIHVALYNEKRVVERLIAATTSQSYSNPAAPNYQTYEVIIADDSTDETTQIAKKYLTGNGWSMAREELTEEREVFIFTPHTRDTRDTLGTRPVVKLIHRFSRSGYKGAALQGALEITNPKAAYITIFDADFVPYPDTLQQFIKSFQALGANDPELTPGVDLNANRSTLYANDSSSQLNPIPSTLNANNIAAVQGYQWHVLNKSQNWVTRGVRTEYAGSYVIERAGEEIYGGLKQISGSVYCIRADVLRQFGWGTSITEDFELTLRLYEAGYKVAFTPYIQAPAEAVSTIKRLIRQRMRWAEGASFNIKVMLPKMFRSKDMSVPEKLEFAYLAPYYLQAAFFVIGTISWFMAEAVFGARLPFWTAAFGWSLVFTNMLSLPLMNIIGLFLEESEERDYLGILSFVALSYIVVPFQAYAAIKGFIEKKEGPWFRTPKTGTVTDTFGRSRFSKFFGIFGKPSGGVANFSFPGTQYLKLTTAHNRFESFSVRPKGTLVGRLAFVFVTGLTGALYYFGSKIPSGSLAQLPVSTRVERINAGGGSSIFEKLGSLLGPQEVWAATSDIAQDVFTGNDGVVSVQAYGRIFLFVIVISVLVLCWVFLRNRRVFRKLLRIILIVIFVYSAIFAWWPIPEARAAITVAGSRIFNSSRTAQAAEDVSVTNWDKTAVFIMTIGVQTANGDRCNSGDSYTVQWRNLTDLGAWTNLGSTGDMRTETSSVLVDGNALTSAEANIVGSGTYVQTNSEEETGAGTWSARFENGEWAAVQFSVTPANATAGKEYQFRLNVSCNSGSGTPTGAATVTIEKHDQSAYRFYDNTDTADVGGVLADLNTAATAPAQGTAFRLRLLMHNTGGQMAASGSTFKLQIAQKAGAACDTNMTTTDETYADLSGTSGAIRYHNNASVADNATLTNNANDPTHGVGPDTNVTQTYNDADGGASDTFTNSVAAIPNAQDGKWDFALVDNSATANTSYCVRMVHSSDGSVVDVYSVVPEFTTVPENPYILFGLFGLVFAFIRKVRRGRK